MSKVFLVERGFTLIELLVVVSIMGILGLIFTDTILQSLRGQTKVQVINQVKQNGQVVLDKLAGEIRRADNVTCVGDTTPPDGILDTITIKRQGAFSRFRFYKPAPLSNPPRNGYLARYDFAKEAIPDGFPLENLCTDANFGSNLETKMTDSDVINGVSINSDGTNPVFSRSQSVGFSDVVSIRFTASQGVKTGQSTESRVKTGGIVFETSIQVRGVESGF